jgi:hypothetical protein
LFTAGDKVQQEKFNEILRDKFVVRSANPNNGILQVHLTVDRGGQPTEILLNAVLPEGFFGQGERWLVTFERLGPASTRRRRHG